MEPTAIQSAQTATPQKTVTPEMGAVPDLRKPHAKKSLPYRMLEALASLRLTVVLFLFSMVLVFYGTWVQREISNWDAVGVYFRSLYIMVPLRIWTLGAIDSAIPIPFPGGWLVGGLLLANLLAAHAIRFRFTLARSGVLMLHLGLVIMMLGEFFTGAFAVEGRMTISESNASNYIEDGKGAVELALVEKIDAKKDREYLIPGEILKSKKLIQNDQLPCDIRVVEYFKNADVVKIAKDTDEKNPATVGIGLRKVAIGRPETSGVDTEQKIEFPAAYVTFYKKGTEESLGTYLVSTFFPYLHRPMEEVTIDGKTYGISLRFQREYRPYTIFLEKFEQENHTNTNMAKSYASFVQLTDPEAGENRKVKIYMNHPLRYHGETFFQSGVNGVAKGTILQVVKNPGWLMPYIGTALVGLGMLLHFGMHLVSFLEKKL